MPARVASRPRVLIFVIAYRAERTLQNVLERVPRSLFDEYDCEILVIDDGSADRTFQIGRGYRKAHPEIRMTVLRNEYNQGYGGNQKVGYTYAIAEGFDFVAMVHGDGQYAPEELPRLLAPLRDGTTDVVFGTRMSRVSDAWKGGMPLYKIVGNTVLTRIQNRLLGTSLSEFHSGYRIYSTRALERIQYRRNSNDFHFDTEIIIQLLNAKQRILELPIPTYYGDEICHVNGMKYAKDVLVATAKNAFHRKGLLHQNRYEPVGATADYTAKLGYASSHSYAIDRVPEKASVLDVGGGGGYIARELIAKGCSVTVVERSAAQVHENAPGAAVVEQDLDAPPRYDLKPHQFILLLDVIEHLRSPEKFLDELHKLFEHETKTIILTTPNIAFVVQRLMLLFGQFNYGKKGTLDSTHTRLFTFRSIERLLTEAGFRVKATRGVPAPFPVALGDGLLGRAAVRANLALIRVSKTLFSYQIYVEAESTPDVDFLLEDAKIRSARRHDSTIPPPARQSLGV